jgi:hypothetical protein
MSVSRWNISQSTWTNRKLKWNIIFTHSLMELSPPWEAANCAGTQELPSVLWNPKVHYRVHKSPPLVPILSQIDPIHTIPSYLSSILILSTHLRLGLLSGSFLLDFPPISYIHSSSPPFVLHALPIDTSLSMIRNFLFPSVTQNLIRSSQSGLRLWEADVWPAGSSINFLLLTYFT